MIIRELTAGDKGLEKRAKVGVSAVDANKTRDIIVEIAERLFILSPILEARQRQK